MITVTQILHYTHYTNFYVTSVHISYKYDLYTLFTQVVVCTNYQIWPLAIITIDY